MSAHRPKIHNNGRVVIKLGYSSLYFPQSTKTSEKAFGSHCAIIYLGRRNEIKLSQSNSVVFLSVLSNGACLSSPGNPVKPFSYCQSIKCSRRLSWSGETMQHNWASVPERVNLTAAPRMVDSDIIEKLRQKCTLPARRTDRRTK